MDWFSKNFPSLARLISTLGKTTQRRGAPRTRGRGRGRRAAATNRSGLPLVAEIGASPEEARPLLATEEADQRGPTRVEEAFHDLAPSDIGQDAVSQELGEARPVSQELGEARPVSQELGEARPVSQELGEARPGRSHRN